PSYTATACYHKVMSCPSDINGFLQQSRDFAMGDYAHALIEGSKLSDAERQSVAKKLSQFTGLSTDYVLKANLRVTLPQFMQELQRSKGETTGRLDSASRDTATTHWRSLLRAIRSRRQSAAHMPRLSISIFGRT